MIFIATRVMLVRSSSSCKLCSGLCNKMNTVASFLTVLATLGMLLSCQSKVLGSCRGSPDLTRCSLLEKPFHLDGVCYKEKCIVPDPVEHTYRISARYSPQNNTDNDQTLQEMWIRGSGPGLTWSQPIRMQNTADEWIFEYSYTSDPFDVTCTRLDHCGLLQRAVEFRLYKGNQGRTGMLGPNYYFRLPLSQSAPPSSNPTLHTIQVYPWFHSRHIREQLYDYLTYTPVFERSEDNWRNYISLKPVTYLAVYYPPSFHENKHKTYPLVLTAGSSYTSTKMSNSYLEYAMAEEGSLEEVVIVVLPPYRYIDTYEECSMSPYENYCFKCKEVGCLGHCLTCSDPLRLDPCEASQFRRQLQECTNANPCGQRAEEFLEMIEFQVLPMIQEVTQNRVHLDYPRHRITITGYRHGGLFACWAAMRRPDIFQNVACLSPSFYLGIGKDDYEPLYEFKEEIEKAATKAADNWPLSTLYSTQNYYIDMGEADSKMFAIYDAYQTTLDVVEHLKHHLHFRLGENLYFEVFPKYSASKGIYDSNVVENDKPYFHRLLYPLLTFFRPAGGKSIDFPRTPKLNDLHFAEWEVKLQDKLFPSLSKEGTPDLGALPELVKAKNSSTISTPLHSSCHSMAISMPVYLSSLAATVVIVSSVTAALICLRNANKKAGKKQVDAEEDDIEDDSGLDESK